MPLENRNLEPGTVLVARYKKQDRACEVVQTDDGLRYRTDDGEVFKSPSSAAKHVMGGIAANGWRFWSLQGTERPARTPKAKAETKKPAAKKSAPKKAAKKKAAKKPKAQRAAAKGDAYGCGACGETFPTMKAATKHALTHTA